MKYELRPYQKEASDKAIEFFLDKNDDSNAIMVLSTAAGKSLIISDIADRLNDHVLVFSLSKELVEQDYEKMRTYTDDCAMFCASTGHKEIAKITFASVASAKNQMDEFKHFKYVIVDEVQSVNSEQGMYFEFFKYLGVKVLGLTATPYRLTSESYWDKEAKAMRTKNSKITMLTNEEKPIFSKIIYNVDTKYLQDQGFLSSPIYYDARPKGWNEKRIFPNSSGSDFSEKSIRYMMDKTDHLGHFINICQRLLYPHSGIPRRAILAFTMFVEDAASACDELNAREGGRIAAYVCGTTTKKNREMMINEFKRGELKVLINVNCLSTGFDFPELDTIVLGRPTMSLTMYYQQVGRVLRIAKGKQQPWVVDTVGNTRRFGSVSYLQIHEIGGKPEVVGWVGRQWKQLTGVILDERKNDERGH